MRTFIAVPCPQDLRKKLFGLGKEFTGLGDLKFVEEENMHLTLKFLEETNDQKAEEVIEALNEVKEKPFELSIKGLGVFPTRNYVRVLWAGVDKGQIEMKNLQSQTENLLAPLGFKKEREFTSHLTIARIRYLKDKENFLKTLDKYSDTEFGSYKVDRIDFMESKLSRAGPIYSVLKSRLLQ